MFLIVGDFVNLFVLGVLLVVILRNYIFVVGFDFLGRWN